MWVTASWHTLEDGRMELLSACLNIQTGQAASFDEEQAETMQSSKKLRVGNKLALPLVKKSYWPVLNVTDRNICPITTSKRCLLMMDVWNISHQYMEQSFRHVRLTGVTCSWLSMKTAETGDSETTARSLLAFPEDWRKGETAGLFIQGFLPQAVASHFVWNTFLTIKIST